MKNWKIITIFLIIIIPGKMMAQVEQDLLKVAYIERITRFVEWPSEFPDTNSTATIGVVNDKAFAKKMEEIFKSRRIKNLTVNILALNKGDDISSCQICYLNDMDLKNLELAVNQANKHGVLLFSQGKISAKAGVHFNFYIEDKKLKFEINESSVKSAGFKISHLLMKSARII